MILDKLIQIHKPSGINTTLTINTFKFINGISDPEQPLSTEQDSYDSLLFSILPTLLIVLAIVVTYRRIIRPRSIPKTLPGPPRLPVAGVLPYMLKNWENWPTESMKLCHQFKHKTWGGPCIKYGAWFHTDDPATVKYILKDNVQNYEKGAFFRSFFSELLGNGIFVADGNIWKAHRKISSRLFTKNLLRYSSEIVNKNCHVIIRQFERAINQGETKSITLDLQDIFYRLTMDSTAESIFGFQLNCLGSEEKPKFAQYFDELQHLSLARFVNPLFEIQRLFQLTNAERRINFLKKEVDKFCHDVIQNKKKALEIQQNDTGTDESEHGDLIDLFLKYGQNDDNSAITEGELRDVIMNFMVAGRDTTASGLSWIFYELSKHPNVVKKIVDEVNSVCGPPEKADYSFDNISKLTYTHHVVMEGLRLHPPVPFDSKFAIRDDVLPDGTHVPAGAIISYVILSMGRSEQLWGEDASEFKPERFLNAKEPSAFKFSVFNAGPRMCLGKPAALATMKMVMAQLLPRFCFVDATNHSGEMEWLLIQKMKGGFPVSITMSSQR